MRSLFPDPDIDDLYDFSLLHKIVLGLTSNCSVANILSTDSSQLDSRDSEGRTPLSWAVERGDIEMTKQLLSYKADSNMPDCRGVPPLTYAAKKSTACARLLLNTNANTCTEDKWYNYTMLHYAVNLVRGHQTLQMTQFFVEIGVDINAGNRYRETPLQFTTELDTAQYLIRNGAKPSHDMFGNSALSRATQRNDHDLINLFLREHHDHTENMSTYGTFLHMVAQFADTETLRLLAHGNLRRRCTTLKDKAGLTPVELAFRRHDIDAKWRTAFADFIESIDDTCLQYGSGSCPDFEVSTPAVRDVVVRRGG